MISWKEKIMISRRMYGAPIRRGLCTAEVVVVEEEEAEKAAAATAKGGKDQRLYKRLSALGWEKGLVAKTINEYIREGKVAHKVTLETCIRELRKYGRHHQAFEIMEWMEKRRINFSYSNHAMRLDLISKVHGIDAAENYFSSLPPSAKNQSTYGALLNCYCVEKMTDKALELFQKMDEMGMASGPLAFNNIMSLYMRLKQPEKVPPLIQIMKERNIQLSTFTYNIWMNSYACLNNIEGVERVFEEIKEAGKQCDWTTYSNLAVAYVKLGLHEKAELALKKLEEETRPHNREAFGYMISLYASISNLGEVHRVWNSLKSKLRAVTNISYLTMLQALSKLNDIEGMKKIFEEWESTCSSYDIRLANVVIGAYLRHNMVNEAEAVLRQALDRSHGPFFAIWEMFMTFYLNNRQMKLALLCMETATSRLDGSEWQPKSDNVSKFLSYFEEEKDIDGAEEFCKYLEKIKHLDYTVYEKLLQTYIAAGKIAPDMRKRLEEDGIDINPEIENLLENVCPE